MDFFLHLRKSYNIFRSFSSEKKSQSNNFYRWYLFPLWGLNLKFTTGPHYDKRSKIERRQHRAVSAGTNAIHLFFFLLVANCFPSSDFYLLPLLEFKLSRSPRWNVQKVLKVLKLGQIYQMDLHTSLEFTISLQVVFLPMYIRFSINLLSVILLVCRYDFIKAKNGKFSFSASS